MTANIIRRLLEAKPFARFTLQIGSMMDMSIDDPKRCRLDEEEMLYVSCPEVRAPKFVRHPGPLELATVEIIDLRHVSRVSVRTDAIPGRNRKSAIGNEGAPRPVTVGAYPP